MTQPIPGGEVDGVPVVRCKFYFRSMKVEESTVWDPETKTYGKQKQYELTFNPVTEGSPENKAFWKYTPSGNFNFTTINEEAAKKFEFGHEYYVDFTPA